MNQDTPDPSAPENETDNAEPKGDQTEGNDALQDFFRALPGNFRWPKPDEAAVAAAEQAIQRAASSPPPAPAKASSDVEEEDEPESVCPSCGGLLPTVARFCVWCGIPTKNAGGDVAAQDARQRHVHHHFHHLMPAQGSNVSSAAPTERPASAAPVRQPTVPGGRAETAARQVVRNWMQACNIRHIDDLLELYSADATVIRSNIPPIRSLPAIRSFLASLLEAGLGDVEMESLRFELLGDIAIDIGRCKMLVPVAMGKRREERGKYLIVMTRQAGVEWKIIADSWSSDSPVNAPMSEPGKRAGDLGRPPSPTKPR